MECELRTIWVANRTATTPWLTLPNSVPDGYSTVLVRHPVGREKKVLAIYPPTLASFYLRRDFYEENVLKKPKVELTRRTITRVKKVYLSRKRRGEGIVREKEVLEVLNALQPAIRVRNERVRVCSGK